jgi:UDP-GlcNAc3NAcA epimerase
MPLHPRTRKAIDTAGLVAGKELRIIEPVGYLDMAMLERHARLIVTDSGGVQKEAYFHGVPCLTLRGETEWVELIERGGQRLHVPQDVPTLVKAMDNMLDGEPRHTPDPTIFGDGHAAEKIVEAICRFNA